MRKFGIFALLLIVSGSAHANKEPVAVYTVPVQDPALKPYATFSVVSISYGQFQDPDSVSFALPIELTGTTRAFLMSRDPVDPNQWSGEHVDGVCKKESGKLRCQVEFHDLAIDSAQVKITLASKFSNPAELKSRIAVAEHFSHEPIGVFTYKIHKPTSLH